MVESVNLLVNSNGTVVRSEVVGALKMRTYLSGMPECKLGLNDKASPSPPNQTVKRKGYRIEFFVEARYVRSCLCSIDVRQLLAAAKCCVPKEWLNVR